MLTDKEFTKKLFQEILTPIKNDEQFNLIQNYIDGLIDAPSLTIEEQNLLYVLGLIVSDYEKDEEFPDIYGGDLLKELMLNSNINSKELSENIGINTIDFDLYLNGINNLTEYELGQIADYFGIKVEAFYPV